jgi:Mannosyl-glycoprotein endo-beta-N-acetylglucosaminidase
MRTHPARRAVLVVLTALVALSAAVPVATVDARSRARKIEPRHMTPYRPGRTVTPNTDILSVSGYAAWMIDEALRATTPLPRLGAAFVEAERREGVNARYLVAHAMLESGWGTSAIARYKRNLFGYGAYDRDPWRYATRFRSYKEGILAVAAKIRDNYLTPSGRWWYGFTTLRAMNRYYASDVRWADKIAVLANAVDRLVVTLKERRLRFGRPTLSGAPSTGSRVTVTLPWTARRGAGLPAAIRFRARWAPVALAEASAGEPGAAEATPWTPIARARRTGHAVRLPLRAPSQPGVWRLEVEARDSDGKALPATDNPQIRPLTVRVAGQREAGLALAVDASGSLAATVRNIGREPIDAAAFGTATVLEAWALPLDPSRDAYRLAALPLRRAIPAGRTRVVRFRAPSTPSVVVVRLAGDPGAIGRTVPLAALVGPGADGRRAVTPLSVASPRDDLLLGRTPPRRRVTLSPVPDPGSVLASVVGGTPTPEMAPAVEGVEGALGRPWLLVRSIAVEPSLPADPTQALPELPEEPPTPARVQVSGLGAGMRLVVAGIVPRDGTPTDLRTLSLAWIPVAEVGDPTVAAH